ncbi:hypothetical protein HZF08_04940 [Paenibacillus sp. CGMCC 1.16610]|uniref:Uncharacterized protein n=1 Tax=Paenibacillus anseongense TaxID=2682845 RepID=A0ABW9UBR7_9BACL|nr:MULTISPECIES: hypothetical protein [Paenibacillus]MBA2937640.1 hypothetical protein [Paenibacillus sp. CGMCC 1.16610]MVQ36698.1 hypothetical protein [Paenibacillus anseongense]
MSERINRTERKKVAAIVTEYRPDSHAEMIIGRLLGLFGYTPQIEVVSLYLDQVPSNDIGMAEAQTREIPVYGSILEAIAATHVGSPIDGVLLIGEHGDYPWNEKRQKLYPRRYFFEETFRALDLLGLNVPIFNDKHLSYCMQDAEWIYRGLAKRGLPFLGGSSIPHAPQVPSYPSKRLEQVKEIFVVSWLGIESYGFHGMEVLQAAAEQRAGGETGIASVQTLEGRSVWAAMDRGEVPEDLMIQALGSLRDVPPGNPRDHVDVPVLFILTYTDGLKGYVLQLQRFIREWALAFREANGEVTAARWDSGVGRPYKHFDKLTGMIEQMVLTGRSPVCTERTLITTGMINLAMESLHLGKKIDSPQLCSISYTHEAEEEST